MRASTISRKAFFEARSLLPFLPGGLAQLRLWHILRSSLDEEEETTCSSSTTAMPAPTRAPTLNGRGRQRLLPFLRREAPLVALSKLVCECVAVRRLIGPSVSACSPVATCYLLLCFPNVALLFLLLTLLCLLANYCCCTTVAAACYEARRGRERQQTELLAGSSSLMIGLALKGGC